MEMSLDLQMGTSLGCWTAYHLDYLMVLRWDYSMVSSSGFLMVVHLVLRMVEC